ncbi:MAG TPA: hypothetical protein V6D29_11265 [Leptolyngbyaceae cyanobacterium]
MHISSRLMVILGLVGLLTPSAALANSSTEGAYRLLPLESRAISAGYENDGLDSIANQINRSVGTPADEQESITDVVQIPLLDQLLDENGKVNLPMGLTVFTTLGDPSVGFGSDF